MLRLSAMDSLPSSPHARWQGMRHLGVLFSTLAVLAAGSARAKVAIEPVRRNASITVDESVPSVFSPTSEFLGVSFVIPTATTRELARYQRGAGAQAAARWLCGAYTVAPAVDPQSASLRGLMNTAAEHAERGIEAANTLVCPNLRQHPRDTVTRRSDGCIFEDPIFGGHSDCHIIRYKVMSHDLAFAGTCASTATAEQREAVDSATCQYVLLGRSGRATALRFFTRRAARHQDCLRLSLVEGGGVVLYPRAPGCE